MKFTKHRTTWLAMPLVGVLVSCGGEGDKTPQPQTREVELRIIDGYLHRASVWLDSNGNGQADPGEPQTLSDEQGRARLSMPVKAVGVVMARAIAGQTRDLDQPDRTVARDFLMMAPADSRLVTPFTTYLALQQQQGRTPEDALSRLRSELAQPKLDPALDYVASAEPVVGASARALAQLLPETAQKMTEQGEDLLSQGASSIGDDLRNQQQNGQAIVTDHWQLSVQDGVVVLSESDLDGDGVKDSDDLFPNNQSESQDSDKDGIGNNADPDDDNDGWSDADELRLKSDPLSAASRPADLDGDKIADGEDTDRDGDGVDNDADAFPDNKSESQDSDKDGIGNNADTDDDNDGWSDADELRLKSDPRNAASQPADLDGDKIADGDDADRDGDGVDNDADAFPSDKSESQDSDKDGIGNNADPDDDNDGWSDADELRLKSDPLDAASRPADLDGDKIADGDDADRDGDGVDNEADAFPSDKAESQDSDKDGIGNNADTDDDNDGWKDADELRLKSDPLNAASQPADLDGDKIANGDDADRDGDGVDNEADVFPDNKSESQDSDKDGIGNNADTDDDNDGWKDADELRLKSDPLNAASRPADLDGDKIADGDDADRDGDGVDNEADVFPDNKSESQDSDKDGIGNNADPDDDNDGWKDADELRLKSDPLDAASRPADLDGDKIADGEDTDRDGDGVDNEADAFPSDQAESQDSDQDGIGNNADTDDDNDGWSDADELRLKSDPLDAASRPADLDGDKIADAEDTDRDGDGVDNDSDAFPGDQNESYDSDQDGIGNNADTDDDNDGWRDADELRLKSDPLDAASRPADLDGDKIADGDDADRDGDGVNNDLDAFPDNKSESQDSDQDGSGNNADPDDDNDGWSDIDERRLGTDPLNAASRPADLDGDKIADSEDGDRDGDGVNNDVDAFPNDPQQSQLADQDGDGVPDARDAFPLDRFETLDSNADGWGDVASGDDDGDGIPDSLDSTPTGSTGPLKRYEQAVIHYRRADGHYDGWGLHLWNNPGCDSVVSTTEWNSPQVATGSVGPDGIRFNIPLKPEHGRCVNFVIHKGELRAWGGDGYLDLDRANTAYTFDGNANIYYQPQSKIPVAMVGAAAHWLDLDTLAWSAPSGADHYELWASKEESVDLGRPESFTRQRLSSAGQLADARFPHLKGRGLFTLGLSADQARALLKQALVAVAVDGEGNAIAATQVQTPFVIDALYTKGEQDADEARLGAWMEGGASHFRLWAPTARKVALYLYDADKRPLPQSPVTMTEDASTGIWTFDGAASLEGSFYRYQLEAFHYKTGKLEQVTTTDPYSASLSIASRYSQLVDLQGEQAKPAGWDGQNIPPLAKPEDSIIYELHIRDFSNTDKGGTPAYNGKYLAFTEGDRASVQHLKALRTAGLNTIHLLPSFDLSSVEEESARRMDLDDDVSKLCDPAKGLNPKASLCAKASSGTLRSVLEGLDPASGDVQALLAEIRPKDGFNWGYDPYHYNAPEGSYAVESDGLPRIREYRNMVQALHQMGFRVVQDVVFNHTSSSGLYNTSVFDKVVPGYYHRRNPDNGLVESSTCCDNTASEHRMFEKLVADSLVSWASEYKIDGFRFDLMGHLMKSSVVKALEAVKRVDSDTWFYGEGWDFGEVLNNARGINSSQWNMAGTGIGTYNDRLRDAVRGDHSDPMNATPGFANAGDRFDNMGNKMDLIRLGMAGNLQSYPLPTGSGTVLGRDYQFGGHGAGYAADPQEAVNYVSKHDNQTLWDINQYKAKGEVSSQDRARMQIIGLAPVLLGQGVPFLHMGSELLRSKSMERDSYDSGDWYNRVDFSKQGNNWNVGLPRQDKDGSNWEWIGRIIANPNTQVGPAEIAWSDARFRELLSIRAGSELLRLGETDQILKRVRFHGLGNQARPGTIVMTVDDGVAAGQDLDPANQALAVAINGSIWEQRVPIPGADGFVLHPVLVAGGDERLRAARVEKGELVIPGLSVVVFAKPQQGEQGAGMDVGVGEPLFLRGTFSNTPWDASVGMAYKGAGVYETTLTLTAGSHALKVGSGDWDPQFGAGNLSAGFGSLPWRNVGGNLQIEALASGTYRFTLNLVDPVHPKLTIVAPDAPPLVPPPYGDEALYLRGSLTDWQSGSALTYVGNGKYSASVFLQPGEYKFKIASNDWNRVRLQFGDLKAQEGGLALMDAKDDGQILIRVTAAGLYRFDLDARDLQDKTLSIKGDGASEQANGVMMQYFHWYNTQEDNLWLKVADQASTLAAKGITALWLPPASKAMIRPDGSLDVGYATYDLYDLGEFNQQGSVRTRYGDKEQYLAAIESAHRAGIKVYGDVVLNHKFGADQTEQVTAVRVDGNNRNQESGSDSEISAWTRFDFPGRKETYSNFKWHWHHFDGVDWDDGKREKAIFKFRGMGKAWDGEVSGEFGNYDYLMGADLDMDHPEVVDELKRWGRWYVDTASLDGFRLDAVKHIKAGFFKEWLDSVRGSTGKGLFTVGEYWDYDRTKLQDYLKATGYRMALFDAPLHLNFHNASRSNGSFDMGSLLNGTLMQSNPAHAVTLVENHDTQPLQMLESPVLDWFKPLAYSFILLRQEGYPNLFYADYYGAAYRDKGRDGQEHDITIASQQGVLDTLLQVRRDHAYGTQRSYLDNRDVIGWTREGDSAHPRGVAVLMSDNSTEGRKWMEMGPTHRNRCFLDATGRYDGDKVCANNDGWAEFKTKPGSVSVWVGEAH